MEPTTPKWLKIGVIFLFTILILAGLASFVFTPSVQSEPQTEETSYEPSADEFETAAEENPL